MDSVSDSEAESLMDRILFYALGILTLIAIVKLWLNVDRLTYEEKAERKKAIIELESRIKTIGGDLSLLAIRQKKIERMTNRQLRTINVNLIDTHTPTLPKGRGLKAMISTKDH
jgi:hypothetical protein